MPRWTPPPRKKRPFVPTLRTICASVLIASQVLMPPLARAQLLPGLGDGGEMTATAERHLGDQLSLIHI